MIKNSEIITVLFILLGTLRVKILNNNAYLLMLEYQQMPLLTRQDNNCKLISD